MSGNDIDLAVDAWLACRDPSSPQAKSLLDEVFRLHHAVWSRRTPRRLHKTMVLHRIANAGTRKRYITAPRDPLWPFHSRQGATS